MMHSLRLEISQFNDLYQKIKARAEESDLKEAYLHFSNESNISIAELNIRRIDEHIEFIARRGAKPQDTSLLLNMLSHMAQKRMLPIEELRIAVKEVINTPTRGLNFINLEEDGTWTINWQVASDSFSVLKLDPDLNEIVPESLIEILDSAFLCFKNRSGLAALSLVLVAIEATLWDHLLYSKGISRIQEFETYPNRNLAKIEWDGSEYKLKIFDVSGALIIPPAIASFDVEIQHTSQLRNNSNRVLQITINDSYSSWLSDSSNKQIEKKESSGLGTALQRARKEGLIQIWDKYLDDTFRILRNNLVHQSTDHSSIQVKTPFGDIKLNELSREPSLTLFFIHRVIRYISDAYYDCRLQNLP
jgi:hypothetical protein